MQAGCELACDRRCVVIQSSRIGVQVLTEHLEGTLAGAVNYSSSGISHEDFCSLLHISFVPTDTDW
jgi:hypothetical protein